MNPSTELKKHMVRLYEHDPSTLDGAANLGKSAARIATLLSLSMDSAERDIRKKLAKVRVGVTPMQARTRAIRVSRFLRTLTNALRQTSAQSTAYRVELHKQFIAPAREEKRKKKGKRGNGQGRDEFDVLGGLRW